MPCRRLLTAITIATISLGVLDSVVVAASLISAGDVRLTYDPADMSVPHWNEGALLFVDKNRSRSPVIRLFDHQGRELPRVPIDIPGAAKVGVLGTSRGPDGTVAACGYAFDEQGRRAHYLAIISANGVMLQLIRTAPYYPYRVVIASDRTIWTVGVEALLRPPTGSHEDPATAVMKPYLNSGVIRHFDARGEMIGSFVPQATVRTLQHLTGPHNYLVAAKNRVAWYCADEQRYVEIAPDGSVFDIPGTQLPGGHAGGRVQVSGLALSASGEAFLAVSYGAQSIHSICALNKGDRTWLPIVSQPSYIGLYGAEGDTLVSRITDQFNIRFFSILH